ncbi:MAG: family 43 glycosylhydrolase [Verrucomicrobiota bacterium]
MKFNSAWRKTVWLIVAVLSFCFFWRCPAQNFTKPRVFFSDTNSVLSARVKDPSVVRFQGKYWMYYSAWLTQAKITVGIATSDNLLDWTPQSLLPLVGEHKTNGIAAPGAFVWSNRIHLFYQSYNNGTNDCIQHAWSSDGINFTRDPSNPIVKPTGNWNSGRAIDAEVKVVGTNLFLYWATRDPRSVTQMLGLSVAPLNSDWSHPQWTQLSTNGPLLQPCVPTALDVAAGLPAANIAWEGKCIEAAALAEHGGYYYLFYAGGYNNAPQQIGVAVSRNGINFKRMFNGAPLLKRGVKGTWNYSESGHPGVFQDADGRDYLFYQGDNLELKLEWRISMLPVRWKQVGAGLPDEPVLDLSLQ